MVVLLPIQMENVWAVFWVVALLYAIEVCSEHWTTPPGRPYYDKDASKIFDDRRSNKHYYLSACVVVKGDPDLREFVEYHYRLGIDKFYIYDNNSSAPLINSILDYAKNGIVEYHYISGERYPAIQPYVYNKCFHDFKKRHTFIAFIDADEFIVLTAREKEGKNITIPDVLKEYKGKSFGGVLLPWRYFGSSGHVKRPKGGLLKNYRKCYDFPSHWKTIALVDAVEVPSTNPHVMNYKPPYYPVFPDGTKNLLFPGSMNYKNTTKLYDKMYINHYSLKSKEEFGQKIDRGRAMTKLKRGWDFYEERNKLATKTCLQPKMPEPRELTQH